MKILYLIRGLPGAGKTLLAKSLRAEYVSTDDYFVDEHGVYKFNPRKLQLAHAWCFSTARKLMDRGKPVAVANTFTTDNELIPYLRTAAARDYLVHTIIVENRHGSESIHKVPQGTIDKMRDRFSIHL